MIRALYTAASGMNAQQANIDNVAHNLANVNTAGFKKSRVEFEDLVYQQIRGAGRADLGHRRGADRPRDRASARARSARRATSAPATCDRPAARSTSRSKATASSRSRCPSGTTGYTRAGTFHLDAQGQIVTAEGYPARAADHDSAERDVGHHLEGRHRLGVDRRDRPRRSRSARSSSRRSRTRPACRPLGGNIFAATTASGEPQTGAPGTTAAARSRRASSRTRTSASSRRWST